MAIVFLERSYHTGLGLKGKQMWAQNRPKIARWAPVLAWKSDGLESQVEYQTQTIAGNFFCSAGLSF